jgi:heme-degrading monooxygenase HmoA
VVVFTSQRTTDDDAGYASAAARMVELTRQSSGFLGIQSARGADGLGITVCYGDGVEAIAGWRANPEHAEAREMGNARWCERYELRVAQVQRAYGGPRQ